jgi:hypothetical protein
MPFIVINDSDSKEQMRSNMREHMRRNYSGNSGSWVSSGMYRGGGNYNYRSEEAYKEGYEHGYKDGSYDESEEHMRRQRDSMGRFT